MSELTTSGTAPPLHPFAGSSIEQRGYKKLHWKERDSVDEMKEMESTLVESSRLVLDASVVSLEMNGTSVTFTCSGDYDPSRQPRPRGTYWVQANRRVKVEAKSSENKLAGVFPSWITTVQEGGATSSTDVAEPVADSSEVDKTSKESVSVEQGQLLRAAEPDQCVRKVKTQRQIFILDLTHSLPDSSMCEWRGRG